MKKRKIHIIRPNKYIYPEYNMLFCGINISLYYQTYPAVDPIIRVEEATCKSCKKAWLAYCYRNNLAK